MVETKSVKVDNWGVFFLQKLQNFFNKTDYCDLTLQFMDNSQLKVHRLVLSACTDYFNVLEQQSDCTDDILNMPYDLQADVVVPIVNFMYTGTLEFEVNMYGRLLKTAKDMNMTVLLKLLEAHKRSVDVQPARAPPVLLNKGAPGVNQYSRGGGAGTVAYGRGGAATAASSSAAAAAQTAAQQRLAAQQLLQRKSVGGPVLPRQKPAAAAGVQSVRQPAGTPSATGGGVRRVEPPVRPIAKATTAAAAGSRVAPNRGPSRFDADATAGQAGDQFESSFDNISYESRPLITARQAAVKEESDDGGDASSHSFEQLRRGYTGVKRPASAVGSAARESPPEKKPNIEDVKEYIEAHRMRKKIVEEFNEDDDDEEEDTILTGELGAGDQTVDHQKIISEVLKKYPHLVKSNKNIKLKITQKGQQQTIMAPLRKTTTVTASTTLQPKTANIKTEAAGGSATTAGKPAAAGAAAAAAGAKPAAGASAPKKIDSKTMHALIAKGAENTSGPWLCLKCGINGRPISIPSYKGFRRHLINVHKLKIDPKLCEHCGWRSAHKTELHHHVLVVHNIAPPADVRFPKCAVCAYVAVDNRDLRQHQMEVHAKAPAAKVSAAAQQHCIYCNRTFADEARLFEHIKNLHKEHATEDGLMEDEDAQQQEQQQRDRNDEEDDDDEHDDENDDEDYVPPKASTPVNPVSEKRKINVLSSITLPSKAKTTPIAAAVPTSANTSSASAVEDASWASSGRRSGTLDPVTGTFAEDDDEDSQQHDGSSADDSSVAGNKSAASAGQQISQEEADSNAYLEFVMAEVHGEKKPGEAATAAEATAAAVATDSSVAAPVATSSSGDAHFVTEEGATVELTEEQKKELIDQLHDQSGVVMILKDDTLMATMAGADGTGSTATAATAAATTETTGVAAGAADDAFATMEWDLMAPATEADAKESAEKRASAAEKAKELIGEWSADDETDDSMLDESSTSKAEDGSAAKPEENSKHSETDAKSATDATAVASSTEDNDAATAKPHDAADDAGEQSNNAPAAMAASAPRRSYGGSRGSRDSGSKDGSDTAADDGKASTSTAVAAVTTAAASSNEDEMEEEEDSSSIDEPKRDVETMKKDSNIEIKTLINDWGDDDEDDAMDEK